MPSKHVDEELKKQLDNATDQNVEAVFTLHSPAGKPYMAAAETEEIAKCILDDLKKSLQVEPSAVRVFPNLQSFLVSGPAVLVRKIVDRKEVASATANRQSQDLLIRPVKKSTGR